MLLCEEVAIAKFNQAAIVDAFALTVAREHYWHYMIVAVAFERLMAVVVESFAMLNRMAGTGGNDRPSMSISCWTVTVSFELIATCRDKQRDKYSEGRGKNSSWLGCKAL